MINLGRNNKIAITGAGGWLGTELLELLLKQHGGDVVRNSVICFGSTARPSILSDGTEINIQSLSADFPDTKLDGVVHLAFQTRDKIEVLGVETYCFENLKITSRAMQLIVQSNPKWVATVSSGAVYSFPGGPLENNLLTNPYGFVKRVEEAMLSSLAEKIGANLAVGRLWAAMGLHMPPNPAYAISDFISSGLNGKDINIKAKNLVFRRYVDAAEFMHVLLRSAQDRTKTTFDSGGHLIELRTLAAKVSKNLEMKFQEAGPNPSADDNVYFSKSEDYEELAKELLIDLDSLDSLIEKTIKGHAVLTA